MAVLLKLVVLLFQEIGDTHMNILGNIVAGVLIFFGFMALIAVVGLIAAVPVYLLWNWLMPEIFNLKEITYFQAWGMIFLSSLLFKTSTSSSSK